MMENIALLRERIWAKLEYLAVDYPEYPEGDISNQKAIFWGGYKLLLDNSNITIKKTHKHINSSWDDISYNIQELRMLHDEVIKLCKKT